ncbi:hypothetical protein BKA63DRAFT_30819 [Paraphoma chrysanthemicola]|nr:hypothetical protein BKA63DRAFT_30819 [Paraphoma chrysanthemicola]
MRPRQAKAPVLVLSSRQVQKEPKMEQSESKSPASTPTRDYPPNTPDRPAPLSIRSRTSNNTPTAGCRSVSLPVTCGRFEVGTDDVFGISHTSASSLQSTLVGEDTQASLTVTNTISVISQAQDDIDATKDDDTYSSEWFATSSSRSSLETASNESFHGSQTLYSYSPVTPASPTSEPQATIQDARQPADIHARLRIRVPSPLTNAPRFHRPLPLRNYESEAHLYPTSQAQGMSDHNRAISAGSMLHNSRPSSSSSRDARRRPLPMQLANIHVPPSLTRDAQHISPAQPHTAIRHSHSFSADESTGIEESAENERPVEAEDQDDRSSTSTYETYQSTSLSEALTLADFPIPPMQNPVGQLPMTTIRVLTRLDAAVNTGDINTSSTTAALATAYRTVAADIARLRDLLGQTRARGETLESVDWQTLSPFERAWREVNEDLLISIYGRQDTELTALDVEYVDLIARELRESASARWVHEVFCEEVEIF